MLAKQDRRFRGLVQRTGAFESGQNAADHGNRNVKFFASEQHHQLVLAPAGILFPQREHTLRRCGCPGRLTCVARAMRTPFQGAEIVAVEAASPAVKGLPADAKKPAGAGGGASVEEIKKHPLKSWLGRPA